MNVLSALGVGNVVVCGEWLIPGYLPLSSGCIHLFRPHTLISTRIYGIYTSVRI